MIGQGCRQKLLVKEVAQKLRCRQSLRVFQVERAISLYGSVQ